MQQIAKWNLPEDAKARLGKADVTDIQYSPDGKFLAVASDIGIWLYDVTARQEASLITGDTSGVLSLAFSPDGRILASGNGDSTITLHDKITGTQKTLVGLTTEYIRSIAFSPDGKTIAGVVIEALSYYGMLSPKFTDWKPPASAGGGKSALVERTKTFLFS